MFNFFYILMKVIQKQTNRQPELLSAKLNRNLSRESKIIGMYTWHWKLLKNEHSHFLFFSLYILKALKKAVNILPVVFWLFFTEISANIVSNSIRCWNANARFWRFISFPTIIYVSFITSKKMFVRNVNESFEPCLKVKLPKYRYWLGSH